jgi:hypothetical protein
MKEAIEFYRWMLENDTLENCEEFINHSDEDMFRVFKQQQDSLSPIDNHNQPETNNTTFIMDEEMLDKRMKVIGQNGNTGEHYE